MDKIDSAKTKNLADGKKFRLDEIPLRKFYDQAQYIEKTLLPAIEKKSGKASADFQFFEGLYKSLLYAVMIVERNGYITRAAQQQGQLSAIYKSRMELAERELEKYTTMEDLILTNALDHIAAGVVSRVNELLINKG